MKPYVHQKSTMIHAPAANTAAVVTLSANANHKHLIHQIVYSYDSVPTGGRLTITDGGTTVFDVSIPAAGEKSIDFIPPLAGGFNSAVVVTLAAGGVAATGKLNTRVSTD